MGTIEVVVRPDAGASLLITMDAAVTSCKLQRCDPSGFETVIRSGASIALIDGAAVVYDFEAPLDVPVYWEAVDTADPPADTATSVKVVIESHGYSWLKDPGLPSRNLKVPVTTSIAELTRAARAGVFDVINRTYPVVISSLRRGPSGDLVLHTYNDGERERMMTLLSRGTVLLFQTPDGMGWGSRYIHVGDVSEARVGLAMEQARKWTLPFTVVDRPVGLATAPPGTTWQDVDSQNADWQTLYDQEVTWFNVLEG